jgi:predicted dehydrogenase
MKNLAIIGLGIQGKRLLRDFSKISNVVGCTSTGKKENIQWLKKNYPDVIYSKNINELLENELIDAIIIASPIKTHYDLSKQALKANKNIFVEKTITENSVDAKKIITLAKQKKKIIFAGHIFLYHPVLHKLKQIHKNDSITYIKFSWTRTGSFDEDILLDLVSHFCSILIELLGLPKKIKLLNFKKIISSCDVISLQFDFINGQKCTIDINRISNFKKRSILIITKKNIFEWDDDSLYKFNKRKNLFKLLLSPKQSPLEIESKAFISSLNYKPDYLNSSKALEILYLIEKCRKLLK